MRRAPLMTQSVNRLRLRPFDPEILIDGGSSPRYSNNEKLLGGDVLLTRTKDNGSIFTKSPQDSNSLDVEGASPLLSILKSDYREKSRKGSSKREKRRLSFLLPSIDTNKDAKHIKPTRNKELNDVETTEEIGEHDPDDRFFDWKSQEESFRDDIPRLSRRKDSNMLLLPIPSLRHELPQSPESPSKLIPMESIQEKDDGVNERATELNEVRSLKKQIEILVAEKQGEVEAKLLVMTENSRLAQENSRLERCVSRLKKENLELVKEREFLMQENASHVCDKNLLPKANCQTSISYLSSMNLSVHYGRQSDERLPTDSTRTVMAASGGLSEKVDENYSSGDARRACCGVRGCESTSNASVMKQDEQHDFAFGQRKDVVFLGSKPETLLAEHQAIEKCLELETTRLSNGKGKISPDVEINEAVILDNTRSQPVSESQTYKKTSRVYKPPLKLGIKTLIPPISEEPTNALEEELERQIDMLLEEKNKLARQLQNYRSDYQQRITPFRDVFELRRKESEELRLLRTENQRLSKENKEIGACIILLKQKLHAIESDFRLMAPKKTSSISDVV